MVRLAIAILNAIPSDTLFL